MSEKEIPEPIQANQEILSSLTPREVKVLRMRFGIDLEEAEEDLEQSNIFIPPSSGNSGQGGAPLNASVSAPLPMAPDNDGQPTKDKALKSNRH